MANEQLIQPQLLLRLRPRKDQRQVMYKEILIYSTNYSGFISPKYVVINNLMGIHSHVCSHKSDFKKLSTPGFEIIKCKIVKPHLWLETSCMVCKRVQSTMPNRVMENLFSKK